MILAKALNCARYANYVKVDIVNVSDKHSCVHMFYMFSFDKRANAPTYLPCCST